MRFFSLASLIAIAAGCAAKHELILVNRSDDNLQSVEIRLGDERIAAGDLANERVVRISWRGKTYEQPYEFWAKTASSEIQLGSCGYPSDLPGTVIAHLVIFEPEGRIYCRWIPP
jgi:hypothetical protein